MANDAKIHITGSVVEQSCTVQTTVQELNLPSIAKGDVKDSSASGVSSVLRIPVTCAGATAAKGNEEPPFMITPPLAKISAKGEQLLRVILMDAKHLPLDRESVFWLNVQEIPLKHQSV
ncbi:hypothetical protein EXB32_13050 [Salmonella enterica subsp. enterica serovar Stanley]|nr:hypothetical protein [Salmonella enterica subsp. enterica serovar Stanley]